MIGKKLLKWWLIFCLTLLGFATSYYFNLHSLLYHADVTKLSFLIILIFVFTSVWIGRKTYDLETNSVLDSKVGVGWFIAETCLAIGMVGTVTGFLYMLGTAFENIDVSNSQTFHVQNRPYSIVRPYEEVYGGRPMNTNLHGKSKS